MLHVDWHLARPLHHRLSLAWDNHWALTAAVFGVVGCVIAQRWPAMRWKMGAAVFIAAVLIAQGLEPMLEVLLYHNRLGYPDEPERWAVFWRTMIAATPVFLLTVWLCARHRRSALT